MPGFVMSSPRNDGSVLMSPHTNNVVGPATAIMRNDGVVFQLKDVVRITTPSKYYAQHGKIIRFTEQKIVVSLPSGEERAFWLKRIEHVATSDEDESSQGTTEEVRYMVNRVTRQSGRGPPTVFQLGDRVEITARGKSYRREGTIKLFTPKKVIVRFPSAFRCKGREIAFYLKSIEHSRWPPPSPEQDSTDSSEARSWVSLSSHSNLGQYNWTSD